MRPAGWLPTLTLLLALLPAAAPAFSPLLEPEPAAPTRAARFDAVLQKVIGPESMDASTSDYAAWLEQLRVLLPPGDRTREVQFRSVYCTSPRWKDPQQGLAYSDEALKAAQAVGDLASQGRALFCRTNFVQTLRGTRQAITDADRMVALLEHSSEQQLLGEALMLRGSLLSDVGEQARALLDFQRARAAFRAAGIHREVNALLVQIATAYRRMGDFAQAEVYFQRDLARARAAGDWEQQLLDLTQLGYLYEESDQLPKARQAFEDALALALRHEDRLSVAGARLGLASALIAQGEFDAALTALSQARAAFAAEGFAGNDGLLLLVTGQAYAGKGEHRVALAHYQLALPKIEQDGNLRYLALLYQARAASEEALGQLALALADYKRYAKLQTELQSKMRLEQSRLLEYEYEIRRRDFENRRLQAEAQSRQLQLNLLQRERRWQSLALLLGALLLGVLAVLAWRQWQRARQLRTLAMTDPLTGTASRLAIEKILDAALADAHRHARPLSVLLLDLDHFKEINDGHGHAAGDTVLRLVTQAWQTQLRDDDRLGRLGGEEFAVVCPGATEAQAEVIANRLLDATRHLDLSAIDPGLRITTSIGISQAQHDDSRERLLRRADVALYQAKQDGRDRSIRASAVAP
ncbi:MAG: diguanylate cyclase [Thermomonas hydrothermalis]|uniref:diguanylate cyclase n=1 Tax=Thermomonas hydrothermalis TaxID=213588 RepID=UPI002353DB6C|nr:diguanylate cyclase [Thermomonas hydrothermalis]MCL6619163.1 diguanylate cyclase [Thermomonas hydrothermalis]